LVLEVLFPTHQTQEDPLLSEHSCQPLAVELVTHLGQQEALAPEVTSKLLEEEGIVLEGVAQQGVS
jgi:hypothetical protein